RLRERLAAQPSVESAALASVLPLGHRYIPTGTVDVEGEVPFSSDGRLASVLMVSKGYFETLRIPLLEGRDFVDRDVAGRPNVAVVDEAFARRFWPDVRPVGRRFRMAAGI